MLKIQSLPETESSSNLKIIFHSKRESIISPIKFKKSWFQNIEYVII